MYRYIQRDQLKGDYILYPGVNWYFADFIPKISFSTYKYRYKKKEKIKRVKINLTKNNGKYKKK